jgi:hypothetical protein
VTTVIAPGGQEFVTTRAGNVIRVEASTAEGATADGTADWQAWHAGRIIRAQSGAARVTVLPGAVAAPGGASWPRYQGR